MKSNMRAGILALLVVIVIWIVTSCSGLRIPLQAPIRAVPTKSSIPVEISKFPDILVSGSTVDFVVNTLPGYKCWASIGYEDPEGEWYQHDLPEDIADPLGTCRWSWQSPTVYQEVIAELRVLVEHEGESRMPLPLLFSVVPNAK